MAKTMNMNVERKKNEILSATINGEGRFVRVSPEILLKALESAEGVDLVTPERMAQLEPNINSPHSMACAALAGTGSQNAIYGLTGVYALNIIIGDRLELALYPFERGNFTRVIAEKIRQDMGGRDSYCAMIYKDGNEEHLIAIYYHDIGFVPAAGISKDLVSRLNIPFLTANERGVFWSDPMKSLSIDQAKRLLLILKDTFPQREFPGMASYVESYAHYLSTDDELRLRKLMPEHTSDEVSHFIGIDRFARMRPAGYLENARLPEFFTPRLAIMQSQSRAYMGHTTEISYMGENERRFVPVSILPPLSRELLDSSLKVMDIEYKMTSSDEGGLALKATEVIVTARSGDETIVRRHVYSKATDMVDLTDMPHVLQMYHMANISDEDWNGRMLMVTKFGTQSRNNIDDIGLPMPSIGGINCAARPNGHEAEAFSVGSGNADWAIIKTGMATKYVTMASEGGEELVNLLVTPAAGESFAGRCSGKGYISLDCGTTSTHMELVLDDSSYPEPFLPTIASNDICQKITPISDETFALLSSAIMLPDISGALQPTAVQRFHTSGAPALLSFPNGNGRLLPYSSADLTRLMSDKEAARDLFTNMKMSDIGRDAAKAAANRQAYALAIASHIQLGYLYLLSRGQQNIEVLLAYPKGLRSNSVFMEALEMVRQNAGTISWSAFAESHAAGEYVRHVRPDGLPITAGSPLIVADLGGMSIDIDVSLNGKSVHSLSYGYASIISQLSAGLALMRKPHKMAYERWGTGQSRDIMNSIFAKLPSLKSGDTANLAKRLDTNIAETMGYRDLAKMIDIPFDNSNRKLLEQLYRTTDWHMPINDSFISHWHQLWALPILEIIADAMKSLEQKSAIVAFVGSGSLFLKGVFESDPSFKARALEFIEQVSGVLARLTFVATEGKPEIAKGMLVARQNGAEHGTQMGESERELIRSILNEAAARLPSDRGDLLNEIKECESNERLKLNEAKLLAGRCVAADITQESYDAFVKELALAATVDCETDEEACFGLNSVYELLAYTAKTMDGYDSFEAIVEETLANFPSIAENGELSTRILHYLIAFNVANRNLLHRQCEA